MCLVLVNHSLAPKPNRSARGGDETRFFIKAIRSLGHQEAAGMLQITLNEEGHANQGAR